MYSSEFLKIIKSLDSDKKAAFDSARCYLLQKNLNLIKLGRNFNKERLIKNVVDDSIANVLRSKSILSQDEYTTGSESLLHISVDKLPSLSMQINDEFRIKHFEPDSGVANKASAILVVVEIKGARVVFMIKIKNINTPEDSYAINLDGELSDYHLEASFSVESSAFAMIVNEDIFVIDAQKFDSVMKTTSSIQLAARKVALEMMEFYNISSPLIGSEIDIFIGDNASLLKRLIKLGQVKESWIGFNDVMNIVDEFGLDLMPKEDYSGIVIMNDSDVCLLIDILEDNFVHSVDDKHKYLARNKKKL